MTKTVDIKLSLFLVIGFILFTAVGTVTHELGHYSFAKLLGHDASINYAYTQWDDKERSNYLDSVEARYSNEISNGINYPQKQQYETMLAKEKHDGFIIALGGPLQTMLTGTIGFLILYWNRKKYLTSAQLNFTQWLIIFISLFWLREAFNFMQGILKYMLTGHFPDSNDEARLATSLNMHELSFSLPAAIIGTTILAIVIFKYIPINQRLTFMISGFIGGLLGFYLWLLKFGPILMP